MNKNISPITFIDRLVKKNELGQDFRLTDHQREILRLAFAFDDSQAAQNTTQWHGYVTPVNMSFNPRDRSTWAGRR